MAGIIVAFPNKEEGIQIKSLLTRNGYEAVYSCTTGSMAIHLADQLGEGIVICGYKLPDMLYSEVLENVESNFEMVLVASSDRLLEGIESVAFLETPLKVRDFLNTIELMESNLVAIERKGKHSFKKQRTSEEKLIIEQAKKVLMEKHFLSENEAHRYIQKNAMNSGRTMVDTAQSILAVMYKE